MKQSFFLKTLSLIFVVIATTIAFASCSSDKDEPENPDNSGSGIGTDAMISYSSLPGTWIIESINDSKTGKAVSVNQKITIGSFQPSQENSNVVSEDGNQLWGQSYYDLISYDDSGEIGYSSPIFGFCKEFGKDLKTALVYAMSFSLSLHVDDAYTAHSFSLADFHLSGNVLTAKTGVYISIEGINTIQIQGSITMKKL